MSSSIHWIPKYQFVFHEKTQACLAPVTTPFSKLRIKQCISLKTRQPPKRLPGTAIIAYHKRNNEHFYSNAYQEIIIQLIQLLH